jgi:hypothetical protein
MDVTVLDRLTLERLENRQRRMSSQGSRPAHSCASDFGGSPRRWPSAARPATVRRVQSGLGRRPPMHTLPRHRGTAALDSSEALAIRWTELNGPPECRMRRAAGGHNRLTPCQGRALKRSARDEDRAREERQASPPTTQSDRSRGGAVESAGGQRSLEPARRPGAPTPRCRYGVTLARSYSPETGAAPRRRAR